MSLLAPSIDTPDRAPSADPAATALARAVGQRGRPAADLDAALSLYVRRARAHDEPVERMLVRLRELLHAHVRAQRPDDDRHEVIALVMRRAITAYYRD